MLTTSSYLFLFFSPGISSPILVLSPLLLCTLNIRSLTITRHFTVLADLAETHNIPILLYLILGVMQTIPQLNYLMLFLMVPFLLAILVLFLLHLHLLLLVMAQYFLSVNVIHVLFSLHLQLFSNPLKCQLSL